MLQTIILSLVIIFLLAGSFFWMWKLSKWLIIPIQIILFILLATVVIKVFVTKENADKLNKELEKSGIVEVEKRAVTGAVDALKNNAGNDEKAAAQPAETKPAAQEAKPAPAPEKKESKPAQKSETTFVDML